MKRPAVPRRRCPVAPPTETQRVQVGWAKITEFPVPIPKEEKRRVAALHDYQILDTPPEENFDNITLLAAQICGAPIALMSLVDSDRQWFKSKVGLDLCETARDVALCSHAIMQRDLFIIEDTAADPRFASNPLVLSDPKIRFYAGAPLITANDAVLGTLCVIDQVPRRLTAGQTNALRALSRQVMAHLELRRTLRELQQELLEQRLTERNLRKALGTAETANRSLGELLRRVRHQIGATTRGILAITQRTGMTDLPRKQKACLQAVRSSAHGLLELAEEIETAASFRRR